MDADPSGPMEIGIGDLDIESQVTDRKDAFTMTLIDELRASLGGFHRTRIPTPAQSGQNTPCRRHLGVLMQAVTLNSEPPLPLTG